MIRVIDQMLLEKLGGGLPDLSELLLADPILFRCLGETGLRSFQPTKNAELDRWKARSDGFPYSPVVKEIRGYRRVNISLLLPETHGRRHSPACL